MIQEIERLKAELKPKTFGNRRGFHGGKVKTHESGAAQYSTSGVAEDFGVRRLSESGKVPIVQKVVGAIIGILPGDQVAIVLLEIARESSGITGGQTGKREAGAHDINSADLPTANEFVHGDRPIGSPTLASAKRQLVQGAVYPIDLGVEH